MTVNDNSFRVDNVVANVDLGRSEVIIIPSPCPNCQQWGEARTAMTDIPHFKEVRQQIRTDLNILLCHSRCLRRSSSWRLLAISVVSATTKSKAAERCRRWEQRYSRYH